MVPSLRYAPRNMFFDSLKYALRGLLRQPGFALAAILALALGIGMNTAMFSVVDGVLLKPLPLKEPDQLLLVRERSLKRLPEPIPLTPGNLFEYRENTKTTDLVASRIVPFALRGKDGEPERYIGAQVTENWFPFYGARIVAGRDFIADDFVVGKDDAVILSHGLWQERFAGAASAIGQMVELNGRPRKIVGVTQPGFEYPNKVRIWAPAALAGNDLTRRDLHAWQAVARLKPGVTLERARSEYASLLNGMISRFPDFNGEKQSVLTPLLEDLTGPIQPALLALLGAVAFVLAIACANVANLLLARGAGRQQEFAIRASLGASRWVLAGQLMTEALLLASIGGILGVGLAFAALRAMTLYAPKNLPRLDTVALDGRALLFSLAAVLLTGLLFGLLPALKLSKTALNQEMNERARSAGAAYFRRLLVVAQVAAALVLMTGAGLLIRSLFELSKVDLGFRPDHVITMRVSPLVTKYGGQIERQVQLGQSLVRNLKEIPGVASVGVSTDLPLLGNPRYIMRVEGKPAVTVAQAPLADFFVVTPDLFNTMGVDLKQGRFLTDADDLRSTKVVLVNEEFARVHFPGESPVGKRLEIGFSQPPNWREIVGVVKNVKNVGVDKPTRVQVYGAFWQGPAIIPGSAPAFNVVVRTQGDPAAMAQPIRRAVLATDSSQPVFQIQTMTEAVENSLARERFTLFLMTVFAGVAFLLAVLGLSGVMAYTVAQRTREIGIRMAIGARPWDVLMMVERQAMSMVGVGVGVGLIASLAVAKALSGLLYGVSPYDPLSFLAVVLVFFVAALVSGLIPALRASRINPVITLRAD